MNSHELALKHEEYMLTLRRYFHMHPELGGYEVNTSRRVVEELQAMGIPTQIVGNRNVIGVINGAKPGKVLAIRADMDALPMDEEIDWEYKSTVPGAMHACGHDMHTASLLAAAKAMMEVKDEICGTIYLCFQIAEENNLSGARDINAFLKSLPQVDEVLCNHIGAGLESGTARFSAGPEKAGNCHWKITVKGRGGHGSRPDLSIDPMRPTAMILNQICSIPSNYFEPFTPLVISPCMMGGGTAFNIIPDEAFVEGNIRYFHAEDLDKVLAMMDKIAQSTAAAFGATAVTEKISYCPPVENEPAVTEKCKKIVEAIGCTYIPADQPEMGSDDQSFVALGFPSCYVTFGARSDRPGVSGIHHNSKFFLDEKGFLPVLEFFIRYVQDYYTE